MMTFDLDLLEACRQSLTKTTEFNSFIEFVTDFRRQFNTCPCKNDKTTSGLFCLDKKNDFPSRIESYFQLHPDFFQRLEKVAAEVLSQHQIRMPKLGKGTLDESNLHTLASLLVTSIFGAEYVLSDRNGLLLDANCYQCKLIKELETTYTEAQIDDNVLNQVRNKPACFELSSGMYRSNFLTIWPIFESSRQVLFEKVIMGLAELAFQEYQYKTFKTIVTCTDTAKEIVLHMQPILQEKIKQMQPDGLHISEDTELDEISVSHRGHYPSYSVSEQEQDMFKGNNVLIVTDVVASGKLIKLMAESVLKLGANDVAILTLALTAQNAENQPVNLPKDKITFEDGIPKITINSGPERRRHLRFLIYLPIQPLGAPIEKYSSYKIGHTSIYPEIPENFFKENNQSSLFSTSEMFEDLGKISALQFGLYQSNGQEYCMSISPDAIFAGTGGLSLRNNIWKRMSKLVKDQGPQKVILSTYRKEDIQFRDFLRSNLPGDTQSITIKQEIRVTPFTTKIFLPHLSDVNAKWAIVLLSFVNGTDILGNIISVIAEYSPARITVVCLVNRLGTQTENFVQRINQLLKGRNALTATDNIQFEFISVYSINEFSLEDWQNQRLHIDSVFSKFKRSTKVPAFLRLSDHFYKKFNARSFSSKYWNIDDGEKLFPEKFGEFEKKLPFLNFEKTGIVYATLKVANSQEYALLIEYLQKTSARRMLHYILAILVTQIDFIRTHHLPKVQKTIFDVCVDTLSGKIKKLAGLRRAVEDDKNKSLEDKSKLIQGIVKLQVDCIAGLALLAHSDKPDNYADDFILNLLDDGWDVSKWAKYPLNFRFYFTEERIGWSIVFLVHGIYHNFNSPNFTEPLKDEFKKRLLQWKESFKTFDGEFFNVFAKMYGKNEAATFIRLCENNIDRLLDHIGFYRSWKKHQLIRFLQSQIVAQPNRHNTIYVSLENLYQQLNSAVSRASANIQDDSPENIPIKIGKKVEPFLDVALSTLSLLETLLPSIYTLLLFTPVKRDENFRFVDASEGKGFAYDVAELQREVALIKQSLSLTPKQAEKISQLRTTLINDLFSSKSILFDTLANYYATNVEDNLLKSLKSVQFKLDKLKFRGLLNKEIEKFQLLISGPGFSPNYALIDLRLFDEVLDNVLYNIRHTVLETLGRHKANYAIAKRHNLVNVELITHDLNGETLRYSIKESENEIQVEGMKIVIKAYGKSFALKNYNNKGSVEREKEEILNYGGFLDIDELEDKTGKGTVATIYLISRTKLKTEKLII